jgi:hypothetical protein
MRSAERFAVPTLLVLLVVQCVLSMRVTSATFDEPTYLGAGYAALTTGVDINPAHPPLMKYLLASPLFLVGSREVEAIPNWRGPLTKPLTFGASFLYENRADPDTMLFAARAAVVTVSLCLGTLVWIWSRRLYGPGAAAVTLALYVCCHNIIAHSSLATLDLGVSAGVSAALYALWRMCARPTLRAGVWAGVALAAALLIKVTALVVVILLPVLLGAAFLRDRRPSSAAPRSGTARRQVSKTSPRGRPLLLATLAMVLVALGAISVAYGPHRFGLAEYVAGFRLGVLERGTFMNQGYQAFCWGRYSASGFPWYFLAAFILKTPIPTLLLTLATLAWLIVRRPRRIFDELFLALPIATFFVATFAVRDNLGLRYILPVYPLLYVLIGGMVASASGWTIERVGGIAWRARLATAGAILLTTWHLAAPLSISPHYLAFFNGLFCGPSDGIRYLDDSNIDWGQAFKQLARYLREHEISQVKVLYSPLHLAPYVATYYGVPLTTLTLDEVRNPQPGWYAISAHLLQRPTLTKDSVALRFDWLDRYTPVARIGYAIYLYHFD